MTWGRRHALALVLLLGACAAPPPGPYGPTADEQRQAARHVRLRIGAPPLARTLQPAAQPMPLRRAAAEPAFTWTLDGASFTLDDYLRRQPVTALLVARGDEILIERYGLGGAADRHFLSNSMAKSLVGLAAGLARAEGRLPDARQPLRTWLPTLRDTAWGDTTLHNLLRMGSGMRFVETYEPGDDSSRFRQAFQRLGVVEAARGFAEREAPQGSRFNYAGIDTALATAALVAATGEGLARFLEPRLWQAMGAEAPADWLTDPRGLELGQCCLWARPRDWLRLGLLLAHDGRRPDTGATVIPRDLLVEATDWRRFDPPFRPRPDRWGYNDFIWVMGGTERRFALLGVYGQSIFVDPARRLVMVHLAASGAARVGTVSLARERMALWQGLLRSLPPAAPAPR